jgi:hypothetical protein
MTSPGDQTLSPLVRFPNFGEFSDLNSLSIIVQDLSAIYDVTAVAVLPGYEQVVMPVSRIGPRRYSPLRDEDKITVKSLSLSSPLEIVFYIMPIAAAAGVAAAAFERMARAVKSYFDVLAAGLDVQQRIQKLEEDRAMAPERLRHLQLTNELLEQQVRRVTAEADILGSIRDELLEVDPYERGEGTVGRRERRVRRTAGNMTASDYAELLQDPMMRLLSYGGGEIEITTEVADDDSGLETE